MESFPRFCYCFLYTLERSTSSIESNSFNWLGNYLGLLRKVEVLTHFEPSHVHDQGLLFTYALYKGVEIKVGNFSFKLYAYVVYFRRFDFSILKLAD